MDRDALHLTFDCRQRGLAYADTKNRSNTTVNDQALVLTVGKRLEVIPSYLRQQQG